MAGVWKGIQAYRRTLSEWRGEEVTRSSPCGWLASGRASRNEDEHPVEVLNGTRLRKLLGETWKGVPKPLHEIGITVSEGSLLVKIAWSAIPPLVVFLGIKVDTSIAFAASATSAETSLNKSQSKN
ncbi:uncharacterized protein LOC134775114 isoform X2 [Penaeus indicus]|uniref:uncharacterized protein LOC134775114 isoform X2 n=1 Tax=Penaeus indicus TaxID=29960 RepID=UPI00300CDB0B